MCAQLGQRVAAQVEEAQLGVVGERLGVQFGERVVRQVQHHHDCQISQRFLVQRAKRAVAQQQLVQVHQAHLSIIKHYRRLQ